MDRRAFYNGRVGIDKNISFQITHNPYTNSSSGRVLHLEIPVLPLGGPARTVAAHRGPADSRSPPPRHSLMLNAGIYTK